MCTIASLVANQGNIVNLRKMHKLKDNGAGNACVLFKSMEISKKFLRERKENIGYREERKDSGRKRRRQWR